jgi:hypothetical protein
MRGGVEEPLSLPGPDPAPSDASFPTLPPAGAGATTPTTFPELVEDKGKICTPDVVDASTQLKQLAPALELSEAVRRWKRQIEHARLH